MGADEAADYGKLKEAILRRYDINEESYRQRFRAAKKKEGETNRELAARLEDLVEKWLHACKDRAEVMADFKTSLVPLNGKNYPTWKVQCRMALVKDSLWDIVRGTETLADGATADARKKFVARRDRALAIIVLAVDPSLLYLLGEPENPGAVWTKLEEQFQWKTWANKLHLKRKLYALKLKEGGSVNEHVKVMTEIFEALAVIGDAVLEEDRVVHLLASLPKSFNVLVTALEAQSENVPKRAVVTERLLHEQTKMSEKTPMYSHGEEGRKALFAKQKSG